MRQKTKIFIFTFIIFGFLFGCGKSQQELDREKSVKEAIDALKKVQAATEVGVNVSQYGQLLIEAKAKTNEATAKLNDGELKTRLTEAMNAYTDALGFWQFKVKQLFPFVEDSFSDGRRVGQVAEKYMLQKEPLTAGSTKFFIPVDKAINTCWLFGLANLNKAEELLATEQK